MTRIERDFIGEKQLPQHALYGIQSLRATENFPDNTPFNRDWYMAMGVVKLACYQTALAYRKAVEKKYPTIDLSNMPSEGNLNVLMEAAKEVNEGEHFEAMIVPAISGGAGTAINMNVNEIIANRALQLMNLPEGSYHKIDPIEDANIFQSTNDVVPTALRVAILRKLETLETKINGLRSGTERLEKENRHNLRIGFTQMQEAVPSSFGKLFSTYSDALSRDWWRVSKCNERIKQNNLGGSAIGTGITVPRYFVMEAGRTLQKITGLPLSRAENMQDATANLDVFVEIHATMKALAVNLEKMSNDIRLLASDLVKGGITLSKKQIGSSIMPGKVNPVIPEFIISCSHKVYANDTLISALSAQGCLDLNAYIPVIGNALLESLQLLISACQTAEKNLIGELKIDPQVGEKQLFETPSVTTALVPIIGYKKAGLLAKLMKQKGITIFEANQELKLVDQERLEQLLKIEKLLQTGYTSEEITEL